MEPDLPYPVGFIQPTTLDNNLTSRGASTYTLVDQKFWVFCGLCEASVKKREGEKKEKKEIGVQIGVCQSLKPKAQRLPPINSSSS